jgi:hypothetical protein
MTTDHDPQKADRWARLRFAIIGPPVGRPTVITGRVAPDAKGVGEKKLDTPHHRSCHTV